MLVLGKLQAEKGNVMLGGGTGLIAIFSTAMFFGSSALAETSWRPTYEFCRKNDGIVAWSPGIAHHCVYPRGKTKAERKRAQDIALRKCNRLANRELPREWRGKIPCRIAFNGAIVDASYGRAVNKFPPIPVNVEIFDKPTGSVQKTKGRFEPISYDKDRKAFTFRLRSSGATLCEGNYSFGALSATFNAKCFDQTFRGTTSDRKVVKAGGIYHVVPKEVKVKAKGSYIAVSF